MGICQGYNLVAVYCLDVQFASDGPKFVAGALQALSAMVQLELPHVNLLTKVDLLAEDSKVCGFLLLWTAAPSHDRHLRGACSNRQS